MPIEPTDDRATTKYPPPMNVGQGSAYGTLHRHAATGPIGSRSGDPQPIEKEPGWSSLQVPSRPPIPPRCSRPWPRTYLRVAARPSAVRVRLRPIVCRERAMSVVDCVSRTLSGSAPRHSHQTCCHQDQACVTDPQRAKEPPVRKIIDGQQHHADDNEEPDHDDRDEPSLLSTPFRIGDVLGLHSRHVSWPEPTWSSRSCPCLWAGRS